MIHSKNHNGFTLIEVLLAMSLMAMILTPILISQNIIIFSVSSFKNNLQRMILAKNYLIQAHKNASEGKKIGPRSIDEPRTTLTYKQERVTGSMTKQFKDICKETVVIEWTEENNVKRQDKLVSFIFKPENKTEQKS
jgi:prepilin-type N-terminal cleavage/methylation domain-containing protein